MRATKGFSLVELLVSTALMGLLITVIVAPVTSLFRSTALSTQRLQETTQAQNILEYVKGQWKAYPRVVDDTLVVTDTNYRLDLNRDLRKESRKRYDTTCYDSTGLATPSGTSYTISINAVDRSGVVGATQTLSTSGCSSMSSTSTTIPPMKLITVTVTSPKNQQTVLNAIVARP